MIRKIPIDQLNLGMYIHDLNCGWMNHPFVTNRFMVDEAAILSKIIKTGVKEVFIDTRLGADISAENPSLDLDVDTDEIRTKVPEESVDVSSITDRLTSAEEINRAINLYALCVATFG